ncbi:Flavin monooxygenase FMO [Corchorus capsularis]|uniref:Flavin-containing monooxygenase n=1 Tax=Corchorus capsularis TaxID=210143 RepID=A0A1R3I7H1_COCAP|nr:Flavin monooxygenase FMO [Corchorus capsularis]
MAQSLQVAVIGAGTAGLAAARELKREGHRVTVFEKGNKVGGLWLYDPRVETDPLGLDPNREIVHSSLYRSLRVNLPRHIMGFTDYPFVKKADGDPRNFPGHEEVLRFLEDFAVDFGLVELIRLGHEVIRVELVDELRHEWVVESRTQGKESIEEIFEAVVVCNGKHTEPKIAEFPGRDTWPGFQMHSHNYRTPEQFKNQIVVVIGNKSSASDVLKEVSPIAKEVHQAVRGPEIQLKRLENLNNAWQHPMIECAREDGKVVFQDGSIVDADAIIHCTGYKYHFPFLRSNGVITVDNNRVGPLYKDVFPPSLAPWLSFVGLTNGAVPTIVIELQARWVAKVLSGKLKLPSQQEMAKSVQELYNHMDKSGLPKHQTHTLQQTKFDYENWLVALLDLRPLEKWKEKMFYLSKKIKSYYSDNYRDEWDVDKWIEEIESSN